MSYINHQGGLVSKRLCTLVNDLLVWAQNNLRSLKATHVPGKTNQGADMLSRNNWQSSSRLLRLRRQLSLPNLFTRSMDILAHEWPSLPLYAFSPVALLPQVLRRVREQWHKLILISPLWRNRLWVSKLFQLLKAAPWPIPLRRDLLSQANGTIWHPSYGPCMCGCSTGAFRPPRACPKHYGKS